MMEYKILQAMKMDWLEQDVKKYIKDGWKPQGGVAISMMESDNDNDTYNLCAQAMVKEEGGA
jgi:hypothetical protein